MTTNDTIRRVYASLYEGQPAPSDAEIAGVAEAFSYDVRSTRSGNLLTKWDRMNMGQRCQRIATARSVEKHLAK